MNSTKSTDKFDGRNVRSTLLGVLTSVHEVIAKTVIPDDAITENTMSSNVMSVSFFIFFLFLLLLVETNNYDFLIRELIIPKITQKIRERIVNTMMSGAYSIRGLISTPKTG